uniref:Aprataxin and PNKP like factor n=1 Tax=Mola mola TaxID=94237 RepID=A0A3Q3XL68_MOLML
MSGFDLVPVDGGDPGGDPVHLPPGETILGRGPLLGTHVNPCFVQSSLTDEPRPLQRNSWYPLHAGDLFSLLPGRLIYRVVATPRYPRRAVCAEIRTESHLLSNYSPPDGVGCSLPSSAADEVEADQSGVAPSAPKRRVLPAWMMVAVAAPPSSSSSPKGFTGTSRSAVKGGKRAAAAKKSSSLEEEEEEEEEDRPKKRRKTRDDEEAAQTKTVECECWPVVGGRSSRGSDMFPLSPNQCWFRCRKNPVHFQECSHPGDTDYEEEKEEEEDRPECPYGTDCYRSDTRCMVGSLIRAKRTEKEDLIDDHQTGFIKEKQTQENIRRTLYIVEKVQGNEDGTILVSIEAEKAFDSVNWSFCIRGPRTIWI